MCKRTRTCPDSLRQGRSRGFTLLEMLVVLVLVSLITTVLIQGLAYLLDMRERMGRYLQQSWSAQLQHAWFQQSVRGLVAAHPASGVAFQGAPTAFSGLSLGALTAGAGVPTAIEWRLEHAEGETRLLYRDDNSSDWIITAYPGRLQGFEYWDGKGGRHPAWPPRQWQEALPPPQLPKAIMLRIDETGDELPLLAIPRGRFAPPMDIRDFL